jgi:hypothetical protein
MCIFLLFVGLHPFAVDGFVIEKDQLPGSPAHYGEKKSRHQICTIQGFWKVANSVACFSYSSRR